MYVFQNGAMGSQNLKKLCTEVESVKNRFSIFCYKFSLIKCDIDSKQQLSWKIFITKTWKILSVCFLRFNLVLWNFATWKNKTQFLIPVLYPVSSFSKFAFVEIEMWINCRFFRENLRKGIKRTPPLPFSS